MVEDMIKTECLKNELWYCSSLLAAVKMLYGLTVHLFTLDAAIIYYNKTITQSDMDETKPIGLPGQKSQPVSDPQERSSRGKYGKHSRKASGRVQKRRLLYQSRFNVCLCVAV